MSDWVDQLRAIRARAIAGGMNLMSADEIGAEVADRRGEVVPWVSESRREAIVSEALQAPRRGQCSYGDAAIDAVDMALAEQARAIAAWIAQEAYGAWPGEGGDPEFCRGTEPYDGWLATEILKRAGVE